jgi:hypothetical protein
MRHSTKSRSSCRVVAVPFRVFPSSFTQGVQSQCSSAQLRTCTLGQRTTELCVTQSAEPLTERGAETTPGQCRVGAVTSAASEVPEDEPCRLSHGSAVGARDGARWSAVRRAALRCAALRRF